MMARVKGSVHRYEDRSQSRHANEHAHGAFFKKKKKEEIRHASPVLYFMDRCSRCVIAHFQKRF